MTVVCNATPLINFAAINRLDILETAFCKIVIPQAVYHETTVAGFPGSEFVLQAIASKWLQVRSISVMTPNIPLQLPAKDVFHEVVKKALQKDGWQITHDPLSFRVGGVNMSIDLAAEKLIAAEREGEKIAVEIKSFLEKSSAISEFDTALGQFINYRAALRRREPERILYLAVPVTTYNTFFQLDFPQEMVQ